MKALKQVGIFLSVVAERRDTIILCFMECLFLETTAQKGGRAEAAAAVGWCSAKLYSQPVACLFACGACCNCCGVFWISRVSRLQGPFRLG